MKETVFHESEIVSMTVAEWQADPWYVDPGCHIAHYLCDECGYWHIGNRQIVHPLIVAEHLAGMR